MTALAAGASATVTVTDGGRVTIATNGGMGSAVVTRTEGGSSSVSFGPLPERRTFGTFSEGATVILSNASCASFDYEGTNLASSAASQANPLDFLIPSTWTRRSRQFSYTDTTFTGIFWPSIIKVSRYLTNPVAPYYCYVSTDHDPAGNGGIGLLTSQTPVGPWTFYGMVYIDTSGGKSTETPSVIWDSINSKFLMFYQNKAAAYGVGNANTAIGTQSTLMASSTDGINWTKDPNFILDIPSATAQRGDGHTGYFQPFLTRNGWRATSLYGGTNDYDMVMWTPRRGDVSLPWRTDGRALGYESHMTQGAPLNGFDVQILGVVQSGGTEFGILRVYNGGSGAGAQAGMVGIAPISDDYRHITCRPTIIWSATGAESDNLRSVTFMVDDGVVYVYFALNQQTVECISHVL